MGRMLNLLPGPAGHLRRTRRKCLRHMIIRKPFEKGCILLTSLLRSAHELLPNQRRRGRDHDVSRGWSRASIELTNNAAPPALRAKAPKHAAPASYTTKRFAGGALLSAAVAAGTFGVGLTSGMNTGTAEAAPCAANDFACFATEGGAELFGGGNGSIFGGAVGTAAGAAGTFQALDPLNLVGPGGLLIGNGVDACSQLHDFAATAAGADSCSATAAQAPTAAGVAMPA